MERLPLSWQLIKISIILIMFISMAPLLVWFERRVAAFIQDRLGPNRVGPIGILQPVADGIKLIFKEEFFPALSNKVLYFLAPCISLFVSLFVFAVIPFAAPVEINGKILYPQVANLNIGMLYVLAISSLGVYGIMIGGWSSNNKYSLLGGLRASSQMISYELTMGMSVAAVVLFFGTFDLQKIVETQSGFHWGVIFQPVSFFLFLVAALAESNRVPFDLPEGETELVGGYHTEYGGMKFGGFLFAEYLNIVTLSGMMVTLFFGGYNGLEWFSNLVDASPVLNAVIQFSAFSIKTLLLLFFFVWVRWTYPRFRYDQIMRLGWKILLPISIGNLLVTAMLIYWGVF